MMVRVNDSLQSNRLIHLALQGYANLPQTDTGLHMRQRSRAWIVADASNPSQRFVFINAGMLIR
jgi:neutral ceramidase